MRNESTRYEATAGAEKVETEDECGEALQHNAVAFKGECGR